MSYLSSAHKALLLVGIPLAFQVALAVLAQPLIARQSEAQRWALHSQEVLASVNHLQAHLTQSQSSLRGYVMTPKAEIAKRYARAAAMVPERLAQLRQLVSDNPLQTANVERISTAAQAAGSRLEGWHRTYSGDRRQFEDSKSEFRGH